LRSGNLAKRGNPQSGLTTLAANYPYVAGADIIRGHQSEEPPRMNTFSAGCRAARRSSDISDIRGSISQAPCLPQAHGESTGAQEQPATDQVLYNQIEKERNHSRRRAGPVAQPAGQSELYSSAL
jgi:hypothetical protein